MKIEMIIEYIENHHVFFVDVLIPSIASIISFYIGYKYKNIVISEGDINTNGHLVVGDNNQISEQYIHNTEPKNIMTFEKYLASSRWRKEMIGGTELWICEEDETYQIESKDDYEEFSEEWTQVYPDQLGSGRHSINLKINGCPIKELYFIYCDGGRISVPLPQIEFSDNKQEFYWDKKSIDYKIGKIIGHFYIYNSLEGVAQMSKIEIRS